MKNTTVLISGAGVAGAALAYWLRRHGFTPTVVERAHGIRDGGYKIDIRGAALDVVPANIKRMVLASKAQVRMSMAFLNLLSKVPGKDKLMAKAVAPIHRAANAVELADY